MTQRIPTWTPPAAEAGAYRTGLRLYNSLTKNRDEFIPVNGKQVLWYICGPTVYDAAHLGHARAYMTFDIVRRVMEDYFGYDITYQMNITDIDDKIIFRARQNHLVANFLEQFTGLTEAGPLTPSKKAQVFALFKELLLALRFFLVANVPGFAAAPAQLPETFDVIEALAVEGALASVRLPAGAAVSRKLDKIKMPKELKGIDAAADPSGALLAQYVELIIQLAQVQKWLEKTRNAIKDPEKALAFNTPLQMLVSIEAMHNYALLLLSEPELSQANPVLVDVALKRARDVLGYYLDDVKEAPCGASHEIFNELSRHWEAKFFADLDALDIRRPTFVTRVSDYVPPIMDYIRVLMEKKFAYALADGSIYFDTQNFMADGNFYAKLEPNAANVSDPQPASDSPNVTEKKCPADFVLWKASKPREPTWEGTSGDYTFTPGRPGWHIECTVMAGEVLGGVLDIHSGGIDLAFPHHDNELAQSEAYFGNKQWVNYFLHAGHLHIDGLKMSKSLKNFTSIADSLELYSVRQIRLLFLLYNWRRSLDFGKNSFTQVLVYESLFGNFFASVYSTSMRLGLGARALAITRPQRPNGDLPDLVARLRETQAAVHEALCDSIDTPTVVKHLAELVRACNLHLAVRDDDANLPIHQIVQAACYITSIFRVFGLVSKDVPHDGFGFSPVPEAIVDPVTLPLLSEFRDGIRNLGLSALRSSMPVSELQQALKAECDKFQDRIAAATADAAPGTLAGVLGDFYTLVQTQMASPEVSPKDLLKATDDLRNDILPELGVTLEDFAGSPSTFKVFCPDEMLRSLTMSRRMAKNPALIKQLRTRVREGRLHPDEYFIKNPKFNNAFSFFSEAGFPLLDANLAPISAENVAAYTEELQLYKSLFWALEPTA
ncbi:hypothetical protein H696_01324 [Fonticula alba]|uniref:cysteine--tRNA ligase n=1 Tax=Fonticula alba TaxID=691883 RepID=A0A058ZBY7_FONAL|nr:hypothetical protein H696_01324 [Fonticula alba]KCV71914.1 hypothetical protein H696_01324 [Fonticula alba]|eukprot:XP_009493492.1 hypothetical protein H696_01324 [Fonticula alba]